MHIYVILNTGSNTFFFFRRLRNTFRQLLDIESRWWRDFPYLSIPALGPTQPSTGVWVGYRVFPGGKERPGRAADPLPPSSAVVKKQYSYTSTPPMGRTACTES